MPDPPEERIDEIVVRMRRRAAEEHEAARGERHLADEWDGPLEPVWRRVAEIHERSAAVHERTAVRLAAASPRTRLPDARAPSDPPLERSSLSWPRDVSPEHHARRAAAHVAAASAHESAAQLHDKLALAWDECERSATADRERSLAAQQRALAAASRRRAERETDPGDGG